MTDTLPFDLRKMSGHAHTFIAPAGCTDEAGLNPAIVGA